MIDNTLKLIEQGKLREKELCKEQKLCDICKRHLAIKPRIWFGISLDICTECIKSHNIILNQKEK